MILILMGIRGDGMDDYNDNDLVQITLGSDTSHYRHEKLQGYASKHTSDRD